MPIVGYKFYGRNIRPYLEEPDKKSRTILGMTLFSLVIFGAFAIRPSLATISRLRQEVKEARAAEKILNQKINNLSQAQVNYQLARGDLNLIDQALPPEPAVPAILEKLALAAGRNNVTLNKTDFVKIAAGDLAQTLTFTVAAAGAFPDARGFIRELENGVRQTDIHRIKMNLGGEKTAGLVTEIECVNYFREEEKNE